jgi:hypothetical protein
MPISPDSRYCLQGAVDAFEVTPDIRWGAMVGDIDVDALVDRADLPDSEAAGFTPRQAGFVEAVTEAVLTWRQQATPIQRAVVTLISLQQSRDTMRELLWEITGVIAEEYLFSRGWPLQKNIHGEVIPRRALEVSIPHIQSLRLPYLVTARVAAEPRLQRAIRLLREQHARHVEAMAGITLPVLLDWVQHALQEPVRRPNDPATLSDRRALHQTRKALRRSVRAMQRLVAPHAYHAFISADGFVINGHLFDYRVSKTRNLLVMTARPDAEVIPYKLNLLDKQGHRLADGCVVFAATPVLDQVIALALHVRDREAEIELLHTAHWNNFAPQARAQIDLIESILPPAVVTRLRAEAQADTEARAEFVTLATELRFFDTRFYRYRSHIMTVIDRNVHTTLSHLLGIPRPIYDYMVKPMPSSLGMARGVFDLFATAAQDRPSLSA